MSTSSLQTLRAYEKSMAEQTTEWTELMADDIVFHGPVDRIEGKEANIKLNQDFGKFIRGVKELSAIEQGNTVAREMIFTVEAPSNKVIDLKIGEFYTIEDGKIKSVRLFYDPEEYKREFNIK